MSRRMLITPALIGPAFVGVALIAGLTTLSPQVAEAGDKPTAMMTRAADCPALPNVVWWKTTPVKIVKYVDRKYRGNWAPYIKKWENYKAKMQSILDSEGTALVKSRNIRLRGAQLATHIGQIEQRLIVTRCLQNKFSGQLASNPNGSFGDDRMGRNIHLASLVAGSPLKPRTETDQTQLDVEVTARCDGDTPTFQVTNLGAVWPRLAAISIHRTHGNALLSKRRIKLANSQQVTFRVRKRGKALRGEIGLFMQPSWAKRPFRYDTKIRCR